MAELSRVAEEWAALTKKYDALASEYKAACKEFYDFNESKEGQSLLAQRQSVEMLAGQVQSAMHDCDKIFQEFCEISMLHGKITTHNSETERLSRDTAKAEAQGLTPLSETKAATRLKKKLQNHFRQKKILSRRLTKSQDQYNAVHCNKKVDRSEEFLATYWKNLSWLYRAVMNIIISWRVAYRHGDAVANLSLNNKGFALKAKAISWKLSIWDRELQEKIDYFRTEFRGAQKNLALRMNAAQANLKAHEEKEVAWACQDEERLRCYLADTRALKEKALKRFAELHPREAPSIPPVLLTFPSPASRQVEPRSGKKPSLKDTIPLPPKRRIYRWILSIVDDGLNREALLPPLEDEHFLNELSLALSTFGNPAIAMDVMRKLNEIVRLTPEALRRRKQVSYAKPNGWKIFRCGKFRIIMDIQFIKGEDAIKAVFVVRNRDDAYTQ